MLVSRPLGRRLRRRGWRVGMPGLSAIPEQGLPEASAPRPHTGFVLGLDVGSSVIRCHVYDRAGRIRGSSAQKVTGSGRRGRCQGRGRQAGGSVLCCLHAATCSPRALGPAARWECFAFPPRAGRKPARPSRPGGGPAGPRCDLGPVTAIPVTWAFASQALPG